MPLFYLHFRLHLPEKKRLSMFKNYYKILGIQQNADLPTIKKAYKELARELHPDKNPENSEKAKEQFQDLANAYQTLSDPIRRASYDIHLSINLYNTPDTDTNPGTHTPNETNITKGSDKNTGISISSELSANGGNTQVEFTRYAPCRSCQGNGAKEGTAFEKCNTCGGSGKTDLGNFFTTCNNCYGDGKTIETKCPACGGDGRELREEALEIKINPGTSKGDKIIIKEKGNAPLRGGANSICGDLIINIENISFPDIFEVVGNNLVYELQLPVLDLMLGTNAEAPTLNNGVRFNIPAGTQIGKVYVIHEGGIVERSEGNVHQGNQLILISAYIPEKLSQKEIQALTKLRKYENLGQLPTKRGRTLVEALREVFSPKS